MKSLGLWMVSAVLCLAQQPFSTAISQQRQNGNGRSVLGDSDRTAPVRAWKNPWDSIWAKQKEEALKLPPHLLRIEADLREHLKEIKDAGFTRENSAGINFHKRFSREHFFIDSVGRIQTLVYLRHLDPHTLSEFIRLGVTIHAFIYNESAPDQSVIADLKRRRIVADPAKISWDYLECNIPFYIIEEVAKLPRIRVITENFGPSTNIGAVTSKGDTILQSTQARASQGSVCYMKRSKRKTARCEEADPLQPTGAPPPSRAGRNIS